MGYNKGRKRFHKKRKKISDPPGIAVNVFNNTVEFALKRLKRKVKNSELMLELRKRSYYKKPSAKKREKKALTKLRYKYKNQKENKNY